MVKEISRAERAIVALHDHGTRDRATAATVRAGMRREGFTDEEISAAAEQMGGNEVRGKRK